MKKLTGFLAITFAFTMLSTTAFAWTDRSEGRPAEYNPSPRWRQGSENHPFFRFSKLQGAGLYVWHDGNDELHLRAINNGFRGNNHVFTGVIRTDGRFHSIENKELENGDYIKVDSDRNTIHFRFTGRGIDGIDFKVRGGDTVDFDLYKDGKEMPAKEICIGKESWHPWHNNFYLER